MCKGFIDLLRKKINLFIKDLKFSKKEKNRCYALFKNHEFLGFNAVLDELEENNLDLCHYVDHLDLLKDESS